MAEEKKIIDLLLTSPETGEKLEISSTITTNDDSSYSFEVSNQKERFKHTIKTEEV